VPRYDQHFLISDDTVRRIVSLAGARAGLEVLEIGPGRGALTAGLLAAGARVRAVEIDPALACGLRERFGGLESFHLVEGDFLRIGLDSLGKPPLVAGNLPYSVATPMLQRLLDWPAWDAAVLMFQKEVARRIFARPGDEGYGLLSLSVLVKADAREGFGVPRGCFRPAPRVDSAVVRIDRLENPRLPEGLDEARFFRAARWAFAHRRKMAAKSVALASGLARDEVLAAFSAAGVSPSARAEALGLEEFVRLALALPET
jgi:16S rRNA (adenine1518-N6/adenine1519-N6)-dimethyltransferase